MSLGASFTLPGLGKRRVEPAERAPPSPPSKASAPRDCAQSPGTNISELQSVRRSPRRSESFNATVESFGAETEAGPSSSQSSKSASPKKRKRVGYDDPAKSKYAHLSEGVPDHLADDLDLLLCGINPGVESARSRRHYAHPSNHFYKALALSGLTSRLYAPSEDETFPTLSPFRIGLTNLCPRPTSQATELGEHELLAGAPVLLRSVERCRPRVTAFVGKGIAQAFTKALVQAEAAGPAAATASVSVRLPRRTPLAWQPASKHDDGYGLMRHCLLLPSTAAASAKREDGTHDLRNVALFWSGASTSARVTSLQLPDKARWFERLRHLVEYLQSECGVKQEAGAEPGAGHDTAKHEFASEPEQHELGTVNLVAIQLRPAMS